MSAFRIRSSALPVKWLWARRTWCSIEATTTEQKQQQNTYSLHLSHCTIISRLIENPNWKWICAMKPTQNSFMHVARAQFKTILFCSAFRCFLFEFWNRLTTAWMKYGRVHRSRIALCEWRIPQLDRLIIYSSQLGNNNENPVPGSECATLFFSLAQFNQFSRNILFVHKS